VNDPIVDVLMLNRKTHYRSMVVVRRSGKARDYSARSARRLARYEALFWATAARIKEFPPSPTSQRDPAVSSTGGNTQGHKNMEDGADD
jgi:hypothetical protein